jgi:hypothetical protein
MLSNMNRVLNIQFEMKMQKKHFLLATKIILLYVLKILNFIKVLNDDIVP